MSPRRQLRRDQVRRTEPFERLTLRVFDRQPSPLPVLDGVEQMVARLVEHARIEVSALPQLLLEPIQERVERPAAHATPPTTDCTARANRRHSPFFAVSARCPLAVSW